MTEINDNLNYITPAEIQKNDKLKKAESDKKAKEAEKARKEARKKEIKEALAKTVKEKYIKKKETEAKEDKVKTFSFSIHKDVNEQLKELQGKQPPAAMAVEGYKADLKKELGGLKKEMPTFGNFTREEEPLLQSFFESLAWDIRQTSSWGDLGVSELNPLVAPYTKEKGNNPMIPVVMGAESAVALTAIGSIKDKGLRKALLTALALGEGFVVATNGHVYPAQHDRFGPVQPGQPTPGVYFRMHFPVDF